MVQVTSPNHGARWWGYRLCSATYCETLGKLLNLSRLYPQLRNDHSGNPHLLGLL